MANYTSTNTGANIDSAINQVIDSSTDLNVDSGTLVVDKSENKVGVGTAAPGQQLTVNNSTASSATQGGGLRLQANDGAAMASGHRLGVLEFSGAEDASNTITQGAEIEAICDNNWSATENGTELRFSITDGNAASSEVLRLAPGSITTYQPITFSGADAVNQIVFTDSSQPASVFQITSAEFTGGGGNPNILKSINSTIVQVISNTGGVELTSGATSFSAISSDERLKQNWNNFENAIDKINTLTKIGEYQKKDPNTNDFPKSTNIDGEEVVEDKKFYGLSANEVQKILPLSATENKDGYLGLNYQDVFVLALKAIQELSAKVTALENG
jgi:hypothetical protein